MQQVLKSLIFINILRLSSYILDAILVSIVKVARSLNRILEWYPLAEFKRLTNGFAEF